MERRSEVLVALMPAIEGYARRFFSLQRDIEELIAEVIANCFVAFTRTEKEVTGQTLAYYACRQVCDGRRVGQSQATRDVCNRKGIRIHHLDDVIAEGVDPASEAAFLIDFPEFVERQTEINRKASGWRMPQRNSAFLRREYRRSGEN